MTLSNKEPVIWVEKHCRLFLIPLNPRHSEPALTQGVHAGHVLPSPHTKQVVSSLPKPLQVASRSADSLQAPTGGCGQQEHYTHEKNSKEAPGKKRGCWGGKGGVVRGAQDTVIFGVLSGKTERRESVPD